MNARFLVGIDLGTTHTVVAYAEQGGAEVELFQVEQLVAPGEVAARSLLPSVRYHFAPGELGAEAVVLPWKTADPTGVAAVLGRLALDLGTRVPGRLVASAKSWLSHAGVDRTAPILPWGAPEGVPKVSPVAASASYLAHLRAAWDHRFPGSPLAEQEIVLTVPASFDEGARVLTVQAAQAAGLARVRLLEEPQAAVYDWLFHHRHTLVESLGQTRLVLVCDVGGGTTDFTLVGVERGPCLTRLGVGDHLMLGGDNMDLALAHVAEGRLAAAGTRLDAARLAQLTQQCRAAKERLLEPEAPEVAAVTVLGGGARLIGGTRSTELGREEVGRMVVEGFFPRVAIDDRPQRVRGGLVEFGLPFVADPAVTRHLAAFLSKHSDACREALGVSAAPVPDAVLFNGGVFRGGALADRLLEILGSWRGEPVRRLDNPAPDLAVARGAVAYGLARQGEAPRIGGGSARSFFLVLDEEEARRGVCLLPRGTEEGAEVRLQGRSFSLRVGQPVSFHLASTTADSSYRPGELVELADSEFVSLPPIATVVEGGAREVPVELASALTEVGTLEVDCVGEGERRWRLEFQLRGKAVPGAWEAAELHPRFGEAAERVERVFGAPSSKVEAREVTGLRGKLEKILGPRDAWDTPLLRELFGALWAARARRRRSSAHERVWVNLTGYCLRPGYGYPLDDWRIQQLWSIFDASIQYVPESRVWAEWWVLWRRVAGGLDDAAQRRLLEEIDFYLKPPGRQGRRPPGPKRQGYDDMVRLAGSLERLPVERKVEVGGWLLDRLRKPSEGAGGWWAVGRLAARVPFYGSAHAVVPGDVAGEWLERLLEQDWRRLHQAAFAAALIARVCGDRERDLAPELREVVARRLEAAKLPVVWSRMVRERVELDAANEKRVFGESLPPGLRLVH